MHCMGGHKKCNISAISQPSGAVLGAFERSSSPRVNHVSVRTKNGNGGIEQSNSGISIIVTICICIFHISADKVVVLVYT